MIDATHCNEVVCALVQGLHNGMPHDVLREINIHGIFNQVEHGFAAAGVTPDLWESKNENRRPNQSD